jgi:hypothetical protein
MADTYYGVSRPNWTSTTGLQAVTTNMEYITIYTGLDIRPGTSFAQSTTATASNSAILTVASASNISLGMTLSGAAVVGAPIVTNLNGTAITVSIPQTLSSSAVTFTSNNVANLNKLIEIVSERGQPIIMGNPTGGNAGPWSIFMATEHLGWSVLQTSSVVLTTSAGSSSSPTMTFASTAGLASGVTYQIMGTGLSTAVIPTATVASGTTVTANGNVTVASDCAAITFSPIASATGARLIDRIMVDGVNYGWTQDATSNTLAVTFGTVLT